MEAGWKKERIYIAIDLKSFYASVECHERGLDPLNTNLVVADESRTEKTICLAVSPALKAYGVPGRPRLFEVVQKVKEANADRLRRAPGHEFSGESYDAVELAKDPSRKLSYVVARPRMALYMSYSTKIYQIYLKYVAPEDMHVYSVDEVFIDATDYLMTYGMTPRQLAQKMILDVLSETGITATAGVGTNLYLCKIAMDIVAKHVEADEYGVRMAYLDEELYRKTLWNHRPLTDFWRVGNGYVKRLERMGLSTMGDIARCSLGKPEDFYNEELLYKAFGVNAELLIDHAWGYEPCTMKDIKSYHSDQHGMGSGQVLTRPYSFEKARLVVKEMVEALSLDLVIKKQVTDQMVLTVGYDIENLSNPEINDQYFGEVTIDRYGRRIPKHAHGTANLGSYTSSTQKMVDEVMKLYDRVVNPILLVRRLNISANHVIPEEEAQKKTTYEQLDLFSFMKTEERKSPLSQESSENAEFIEKEKRLQEAMIRMKEKYGKNAILKGSDLEEGATTIERNSQIGGHKA